MFGTLVGLLKPGRYMTARNRQFDPLWTTPLKVPRFSTGEVADILGVEKWRLHKFLDSPRYQLSPTGQLGRGRGSRRTYSRIDVYRIGIAARLVSDGFAAKFVGKALRFIENEDLISLDERGEVSHTGILFKRGTEEPIDFFPSGKPPEIKVGSPVYYALDLADVIRETDRRIAEVVGREGKE